MKNLTYFLLWIVFPISSIADVEMKVVTPDGYISFIVANDWKVLAMQTDLPVTASVFQLPNPADEGTPDSTNLIISIYDLKNPKGKDAIKLIGKGYGTEKPKKKELESWTLYRQSAPQGETIYTILDAKKSFKRYDVGVRLAWPQLEENEKFYDQKMQETIRSVIFSIKEHLGEWSPREDEVIRRKQN